MSLETKKYKYYYINIKNKLTRSAKDLDSFITDL